MDNPTLQRAQLLFQQGRYDLATEALRETLAQNPQESFAHALLGLCLVQQKNYEEARSETELAIHHAPDAPFCHYASGCVLQECNRFDEAEAAAREAVRLSPEDADYWGLLSHTLLSQKRWQDAVDAANHGLESNPEHTDCNNLRAMAMIHLGEKQAATQSIAGVLQRNPHSAATHANQGWAMLHQNNPKQALEHFREALRLNPNQPWAREGMVEALKARHLLYRLMLRYYLWMSHFSRKGQWGVLVGAWICIQVVRTVSASNPQLAPFLVPVMVAYGIFVLATWLFSPVFNLSLLISPFGRYLLSVDQRIMAMLVGLSLAGGIVLIPLGIFIGSFWCVGIGGLLAILTLPLASTAGCRVGAPMAIMGAYTAGLAVCGVVTLLLIQQESPLYDKFMSVTILGCVLSSLAANIFRSIIPKKG